MLSSVFLSIILTIAAVVSQPFDISGCQFENRIFQSVHNEMEVLMNTIEKNVESNIGEAQQDQFKIDLTLRKLLHLTNKVCSDCSPEDKTLREINRRLYSLAPKLQNIATSKLHKNKQLVVVFALHELRDLTRKYCKKSNIQSTSPKDKSSEHLLLSQAVSDCTPEDPTLKAVRDKLRKLSDKLHGETELRLMNDQSEKLELILAVSELYTLTETYCQNCSPKDLVLQEIHQKMAKLSSKLEHAILTTPERDELLSEEERFAMTSALDQLLDLTWTLCENYDVQSTSHKEGSLEIRFQEHDLSGCRPDDPILKAIKQRMQEILQQSTAKLPESEQLSEDGQSGISLARKELHEFAKNYCKESGKQQMRQKKRNQQLSQPQDQNDSTPGTSNHQGQLWKPTKKQSSASQFSVHFFHIATIAIAIISIHN